MFTGIIQTIGKVVKYDGERLWVQASFARIQMGESINVDGVCLTVAAKKRRALAFDVGHETERVTTIGHLQSGSKVNLERALRVGDRLGGHWVSGHVEEIGRILKIEKARASWTITFSVPKTMRRLVVPKGSLAIDGISLTVVSVRGDKAKVMVIPHTLAHTTLSLKKLHDPVNLEPDLLAKYALR